MRRALISVADKRGLIPLAQALVAAGYEIISTSGTRKELAGNSISCKEISDITGFPEIMDGRVKTLHPLIHGAILGRRDKDIEQMQQHQIAQLDMVVVNLYPFVKTLAEHPDNHQLLIENIDIGGPAMLRSAAKNHSWVTAVIDPDDYPAIISSLGHDGPDLAMRKRLAAKTFSYIADYDACIADYLEREAGIDTPQLKLKSNQATVLRYGENPHQRGVLYSFYSLAGWGGVEIHQGKELSYNNIADADAAFGCLSEFNQRPSCVIVKHLSPCGVASADNLQTAYSRAFDTDRESAFGGVIALNGECDRATAQMIIANQFAEVIVAPAFTQEALSEYRSKPNIRLISLPRFQRQGQVKSVAGGILWQSDNLQEFDLAKLQQVSAGATEMPLEELKFSWKVAKHLKSNAIAITSNLQTIGIGAGQSSRVRALKQAIDHACDKGFDLAASVLASDAFFPFADSIKLAADSRIGWIIQPGGSIRDDQVIAIAKEAGVGMVFTGERNFLH